MTTDDLDAIAGVISSSMNHGNLMRLAGLRINRQHRLMLHAYLVAEFTLMFKARGVNQTWLKRFQKKAVGE